MKRGSWLKLFLKLKHGLYQNKRSFKKNCFNAEDAALRSSIHLSVEYWRGYLKMMGAAEEFQRCWIIFYGISKSESFQETKFTNSVNLLNRPQSWGFISKSWNLIFSSSNQGWLISTRHRNQSLSLSSIPQLHLHHVSRAQFLRNLSGTTWLLLSWEAVSFHFII